MNDLDKILEPDDESLAIEVDEDIQYDPGEESSVVALEPMIITLGRKKRKDALMSDLQPKPSDS